MVERWQKIRYISISRIGSHSKDDPKDEEDNNNLSICPADGVMFVALPHIGRRRVVEMKDHDLNLACHGFV